MIGDAPQDLKYKDEPTELRIGDQNVFREHFTVHRSTHPEQATIIGSNNFLMANAHIAHNSVIGNHVIMANGALLAGHAIVQDRAFISGNCLVHQFARVGALAMMRGGAAISKDLPPFCVALGENTICGLNTVGLRRAGFSAAQRLELKRLYHDLFRAGINLRAALADAQEKFAGPAAKVVLEFIIAAKRGVCTDRGAVGAKTRRIDMNYKISATTANLRPDHCGTNPALDRPRPGGEPHGGFGRGRRRLDLCWFAAGICRRVHRPRRRSVRLNPR